MHSPTTLLFALSILLLHQTTASPSPPQCRFAPHFHPTRILTNPQPFIATVLSHESAFLAHPNIAYNPLNGLTYDGTLLDSTTGLALANAAGRHNFSAASKEALHIMVLAKAIGGNAQENAARVVAPGKSGQEAAEVAAQILWLKLQAYLTFNASYPGFGGFLPWFGNEGWESEPTSDWVDRVPGLDNGELLWAVYGAVRALEESGRGELAGEWERWLDYAKGNVGRVFYHGAEGEVCAVVTLDQSLGPREEGQRYECEGEGRLDDPYEGELLTWWVYFFGGLGREEREGLWVRKRAKLQSVEYEEGGVGPVTVQKGFWFSSHEQWKVLEMPYFDVPIVKRLFTNAERVRTCNSKALGVPGMYASVNNVTDETGQIIGYISNAGIPSISFEPVQELDVITPYSVFPTLLVEGKKGLGVGMAWWW